MTSLLSQNVVVPIDFSEDSARAIQTALELTESPSAIHLIHVLVPLNHVSPGVVWGQVDDAKREQSLRSYCDQFLQQRNLPALDLKVRFGDPGLEIAEYASEIGADLIVIPSHGYHGVKRLILGSVTERVLRHANCSVLVLRRSDTD